MYSSLVPRNAVASGDDAELRSSAAACDALPDVLGDLPEVECPARVRSTSWRCR